MVLTWHVLSYLGIGMVLATIHKTIEPAKKGDDPWDVFPVVIILMWSVFLVAYVAVYTLVGICWIPTTIGCYLHKKIYSCEDTKNG